jgi:hypothetical protein
VAIRGWVFKHEAEWLAAPATLEADGWHTALACLAAPVQVEGLLPCGEQFYFRARHTEACLAVGGVDPSNAPAWEHCDLHPEASYLPANDGLALAASPTSITPVTARSNDGLRWSRHERMLAVSPMSTAYRSTQSR